MRRKLAWLAILGLATAVLALPAPQARAVPLSALVGAGPVVVGDLVFDDFAAVVVGDLIPNLSFYDVTFVAGGFDLVGTLSVADGEVGLMLLSYTVAVADPALAIGGASLFASNLASGIGAQAAVDEVLRDASDDALLAILSTGAVGSNPGGAVFFDDTGLPGVAGVRVSKTIFLDSSLVGGALGGSARVNLLEQRFAVVPEPGTLALLALGLAGLALAGSRRAVASARRRR